MNARLPALLMVSALALAAGWGCQSGNTAHGGDKPPVKSGSLDQLKADDIPKDDRFPFQPKEIVAVIPGPKGIKAAYASVAFSPDGQWLAGAGSDAVVRVWSTASLKLVAELQGHAAPLLFVTFSPDSKTLASAGGDKTVRLWGLTNGKFKEKTTLVGHEGNIWGLAFSSDGKRLASCGGGDRATRIWDLSGEQAKCWATLTSDSLDAYTPAFSPDGKLLAAAGADGVIRLYDVSRRQPTGPFDLRGHKSIWPMVFAPDGKTLASGDHQEPVVRLWDMTADQPKERATLKGIEGVGFSSLSYSPDGKMLAAGIGGDTKTLLVWDAASGKVLHQWQFPAFVAGLSFAPDGKHIAAVDPNLTVYILRVP